MEIDAKNRQVALSVGEFARFSPYSQRSDALGFGNWRAQVGQQWHQEIQKKAPEEGFVNESAIEGDLTWNGWTFRLTGRIDQLGERDSGLRVREIKTVATALPIDPLETPHIYKPYCLQLLAYRELLLRERGCALSDIALELMLVEIGSGMVQRIGLEHDSFDSLIVDHLDRFASFLDQKSARLARLRSLQFNPAYETPRPGQETIKDDLKQAFAASPVVCLEAPTGYGKTGVAWEIALHRLATGQVDRILYLTSKSTGQIEATERLKALLGPNSAASYWQIRNKAEHCVNAEFRCSTKTCSYLADLDGKWTRASLDRHILFTTQPIPLDLLKEESASAGICPYETMRSALGHRDIWIGDYNYLFSSNSASLLADQCDFDPARSFLIVDEAHNLPSRVESNQSREIDSLALEGLREELSELGASRRIRNSLSSLSNECAAYRKGNILSLRQIDDLAELMLTLANALSSEPIPFEQATAESMDTLWTLASGATALKEEAASFMAYAAANGRIRIACIDPSRIIGDTLEPFKETLLLSATFPPADTFFEQCGLNERLPAPQQLAPPAPWLEGAYDIAIDTRPDTRLKGREASKPTTAATITQLAEAYAPIVVFFPSYAYAETVKEAVERDSPFFRIAMQGRGGGETLDERAAFIDDAIRFHDIVFLVLGSSYAEGIDLIGGKIEAAMVVSPALPEVNPVQNAKRDHQDAKNRNGFERAYLQPGIQKVNQALGRLVRAPGQSVKVLLHCQRFAGKQTRDLLSPQYRAPQYIFESADLESWIGNRSSPDKP